MSGPRDWEGVVMTNLRTAVKLDVKATIDLGSLADKIVRDNGDDTLLAFVKELDERAANWNFTKEAMEHFIRAYSQMDQSERGDHPVKQLAVSRVAEFIRQMRLNSDLNMSENFYTAWMDPASSPAHLYMSDLSTLVELALLGMDRLPTEVL